MPCILAIETATEACSVALWRDGDVCERHELTPRQHSQRLFGMLRELLPSGQLREQGVDAIAYGSGPGSFTGLRIAASAVQGLAFANELPAIPVSTLACQAQTALQEGIATEGDFVFSALDARINEIYHASYRIQDGTPVEVQSATACAPGDVGLPQSIELAVAVGSGCTFSEEFPQDTRDRLGEQYPQLLPRARNLVPLALRVLAAGDVQSARDVQPVYVRDEINWKKLPEQGKRT